MGTSESIWKIVGRELRQAPAQARRALGVSLAGFVAGFVVIAGDLVTGASPGEVNRLTSLILAITGSAVLAVAQVVHQVSQGQDCRAFSWPNLNPQRFHRALVVVPMLAMIALILMSISMGVLLSYRPGNPLTLAVVAMILVYVSHAARFAHGTTRFLHRHAAEQAELAAHAQTEAAEAQLAALQSQMNPHFLFNTLNTVATLVRTNGRAAEATVEHLAEVLRRTLDRSRAGSGTVAEEVDYLRAYLAIEQERFGERLRVDWRLDPETLQQSLPPLALQPLVENALRHGIGARLEGGIIAIKAVRNDGYVQLSVSDNGIGFPPYHREGTGLGNLSAAANALRRAW